MIYSLFIIFSIIFSYFFFKNFYLIAKYFNLIDNKNPHYSFHPTPTGSGICFFLIIIFGSLFCIFFENSLNKVLPNNYYIFYIGISILAIISFLDDIKSIDARIRLVIHLIVVFFSLSLFPLHLISIPLKVIIVLAIILWVYCINISNFIDGSDGFLSINFIFICLNVFFINYLTHEIYFSYYLALLIFPCLIIFYLFNKPPAKIYMGDAGSVTIGYLVGFFVLELIMFKHYNLSISLIAYILCDCTFSLIKKLTKGYMPWIGMYDYYYLKPVLKNKINHKNVLIIIIIYNILNSLIIFSQLFFNNVYLFIFSIILSIIIMYIYANLDKKFSFLKIYKN